MSKKTSILDKEIAKLLKSTREKAGLYQAEVAERIGLSAKSGKGYISHLEKGMVKNPPIGTILLYLRACGASWVEFFKELDRIDFKLRHENLSACGPAYSSRGAGRHAQAEMISQVHPPETRFGEGSIRPPTERKIQRDAMRYEINVEFPSKQKEEIDFERLKKLIKDKVIALVNKEELTLTPALSPNRVLSTKGRIDHQGRGGNAVIADCQKFALEYFDFLATLNKAGMKTVAEKWQRAGLKLHIISGIKKTINNILRGEMKRILAQKPLPPQKQEKMAIGFTKYRIRIERIEAEVHKLLCELGIPTPWFSLYKGFGRECYKALKKYFGRNQELLNKALTDIVRKWIKEGLKEDVLLKLKEKVVSVFRDLRLKGIT